MEESGVEEKDKNEDSRCERMVVLPEPLSPLDVEIYMSVTSLSGVVYGLGRLTGTPLPDSLRELPIE